MNPSNAEGVLDLLGNVYGQANQAMTTISDLTELVAELEAENAELRAERASGTPDTEPVSGSEH